MWSHLATSLQNGNGYIITLLVLAFLGTIIIFERFIMLQMVYHIDFSKFIKNLKKSILAEDLDRAINICKSASHTSLPHISQRVLEAAERDPTTVKGTLEEETIEFLPKLEARIGSIPTLGTIILLVGILGTIDGLWSAFDSIVILDTSEKQARLANGIAGSLNPTALGLLVCMLFLGAHQLLKATALRITDKVHYGVTVLSNLLVPQEMAYVAAAPQGGGMSSGISSLSSDSDSYEADASKSDPVNTQSRDADESLDDASVEDIKDEEEII